MYNGIGVQTARGTGTSGHVMKSLGSIRPHRDDVRRMKDRAQKKSAPKEADPGILYHNALRKVEVALSNLRDELEEQYVTYSIFPPLS